MTTPDSRIPAYLGRVLTEDGEPAGTCFQVSPGLLVTAWHVLDVLGAGSKESFVDVDPLAGGPARPARVLRADPLHDLAVLVTEEPLPACTPDLAATDAVRQLSKVVITGVSNLEDPERTYRYLDADGHWAGGSTLNDQIPLGRVEAKAVALGMSGAPVVTKPDPGQQPSVVGVVSARYNSPVDGWVRDSVWVARTEDLTPLLAGLCDLTLPDRRWTEATDLTLSVTGTEVSLGGPGIIEVKAAHNGITPALADAMRGLRSGRERLTGLRSQDLAEALPSSLFATPAAVGQLMADAFLPDPVSTALSEAITSAQARWSAVQLGLAITGDLRVLPWEALALPGTQTPLALHSLVTAYRQQPASRPAKPLTAGPLRIVIAISAPLTGGGGVLDYEDELRNMIAAVRGARQNRASVQVVHFATTREIRAALDAEPAHVLHLSGHGRPGFIELEDDDGNARELNADQFIAEAIPPGQMPPVIALAACHTDSATSAEDQSFAATLIAHGATAVIGTETAVTDIYATRVFARIYGELAAAPVPDVVAAVARARRVVQQQLSDSPSRREQQIAALGEWSVLSIRAAAGSVPVFDPSAPAEQPATDAVRLPPPALVGLLSRDTGQFVGRRRAQRRWPATLLAPSGSGLVLHGIGGVGKTTLAAELARRITERDPDRLPVIAASGLSGGQTTVDQVLTAIAKTLRWHSPNSGAVFHQVATHLDRSDLDWQARLQLLRQHVLDDLPLLLILDNFEDNLSDDSAQDRPGWRTVQDQDLASLLSELTVRPARCRLLITSRYPFVLPDQADAALDYQPIGPLTAAETMKLSWALPALDQLTEPELQQVWQMVGGHPRCLEYVDALLRGGKSNYPDVTARLARNLAGRPGIPDKTEWLAQHSTLNPALAETLTIAADEVLLNQLLAALSEVPGAEPLLLGMSVYRSPVDELGLLFQIGIPDPTAEVIPDRRTANEQITAILTNAGIDQTAPIQFEDLPATLQQELIPHLDELDRLPSPPLRPPDGLRVILEACTASSLLAIDTDQQPPALFVHRWTATELQSNWHQSGKAQDLTTAHERAASYWQWRVQVWPQDQASDLDDLIEARHHLFAANQIPQADRLTEGICSTLHDQGAWDREDALIKDTLIHVSDKPDAQFKWLGQLADIAQGRGRVNEAASLYVQSLSIANQLVEASPGNSGYQRDLAVSYDRLGDLARDAGDTAQATRLHQQSLAIREELTRRDPANTSHQRDLAVSYNKLGDLARDAGDTGQATRHYQQALAIREQLIRRDPTNVTYQDDLAFSCRRLADVAARDGDSAGAVAVWRRGAEFCAAVYSPDHPLVEAFQQMVREATEHGG